jgi:putative NIF3 family GTP cyclohydrolase 1 type 2
MKLQKMFKRSVELGMQADVRDKKYFDRYFKKQKEAMKNAKGWKKDIFDEERTWNPYSDCRIINGSGKEEVTTLMVGIDIETPEVLLADRLREKGQKIDCLFIHHPEGRALADLEKVMPLQIDILAKAGVPVNHSEAQLKPRMDKIWRAIHADNLFRTERAAELLGIPAFCCHTITDNLVWAFMEKNICNKPFEDLSEIIDALMKIPEFKYYAEKGNPPIIVNGAGSNRPGKIVATEFTGGTNGPEEQLVSQSKAGVGTILSMHVTELTFTKAKEHNINMIQCSHMASDTIGINLLLDKLQKEEKRLKTVDTSGFIRVKRK